MEWRAFGLFVQAAGHLTDEAFGILVLRAVVAGEVLVDDRGNTACLAEAAIRETDVGFDVLGGSGLVRMGGHRDDLVGRPCKGAHMP